MKLVKPKTKKQWFLLVAAFCFCGLSAVLLVDDIKRRFVEALLVSAPALIWFPLTWWSRPSVRWGGILGVGSAFGIVEYALHHSHHNNGLEGMLFYPLCAVLMPIGGCLGLIFKKKPNQSLEPTRVLGTSAAEPPRVPSTRVAHL